MSVVDHLDKEVLIVLYTELKGFQFGFMSFAFDNEGSLKFVNFGTWKDCIYGGKKQGFKKIITSTIAQNKIDNK